MKDLIIVCAGGFGREIFFMAKEIGSWNIKGFIDDNPSALDGINIPVGIIGSIKDWVVSPNEVYILGVANPSTKEKLAKVMTEKGASFITLISPHAHVVDTSIIGEGSTINGFVGDGALVGKHVNVMNSIIGQDSIIGDYCTTTGYTNIASAILGKRVFVGSHAVVLNGKTVGDDATIGAGSVVISNVKANTTVFGNPAKKIEF